MVLSCQRWRWRLWSWRALAKIKPGAFRWHNMLETERTCLIMWKKITVMNFREVFSRHAWLVKLRLMWKWSIWLSPLDIHLISCPSSLLQLVTREDKGCEVNLKMMWWLSRGEDGIDGELELRVRRWSLQVAGESGFHYTYWVAWLWFRDSENVFYWRFCVISGNGGGGCYNNCS